MKLIPILIDTYLAAAVANFGIGIVNAAELTGGDALYGFVGMYVIPFFVKGNEARQKMVHMPDLKLDGQIYGYLIPGIAGDEMHVGQTEIMSVLQLGVPSVSHKDDILLDVLLDYEPRAAT